MNKVTRSTTSVSIFDCQEVTWLPWSACSYSDSSAIFRYRVTRSAVDTIPTDSLQPDEIERANRYHWSADRNRFRFGRHLLRVLLAQYTNQHPKEIAIVIGRNRKPELPATLDWHVNVSHSGDWIVLVIARNTVGIDVETFDPVFDFRSILPASFTVSEQQFIQHHSAPAMAFYQLWTRKEALVKALGKGLDDDFPTIPSLTGVHQLDTYAPTTPEGWLIQSFAVTNGYPAAVAYPVGVEMPKFYTIDGGFFDHFTS